MKTDATAALADSFLFCCLYPAADIEAGVVHVNGMLIYHPGVGLLRQKELKGHRQARYVAITPGYVSCQALQAAWNESVDHSPDAPLIANVAPGSNH